MDLKVGAFAIVLYVLCCLLIAWQSATIKDLEKQNAELVAELKTAKAVRLADQETFNAQIRLIREIQKASDAAHGQVNTLSDLSDPDWLNAVMRGVFNQNTAVNAGASTGLDAGTLPAAGTEAGTATGKDGARLRGSHDAQGN